MSFKIKDCALVAIATDYRAQNLSELRSCLIDVPPASIYYHFWGGLLRPRFDDPEYNNDFSVWAYRSLHDVVLAERLAIVDPTEFSSLESLRADLVEIIEDRLDESGWIGWAPAQTAFHFLRSQIVVFDTHRRVESPQELLKVLPSLSGASIFYHFTELIKNSPAEEFGVAGLRGCWFCGGARTIRGGRRRRCGDSTPSAGGSPEGYPAGPRQFDPDGRWSG
ncbi:MAG: DUF5752 family protein [Acidobacteriota bacterium]